VDDTKQRCRNYLVELLRQLPQRLPSNVELLENLALLSPATVLSPLKLRLADVSFIRFYSGRKEKRCPEKNLALGELKKLRARTLTAVKKHRAGDVTDGTQQLQCYKYGNSASLDKAKSRVLKALPESPKK